MNLNNLIRLANLANIVKPYIPQLKFIFDLLKQYNHELAKSYHSGELKLAGKAGFVYIIREREHTGRFKSGYCAKPPWLNAQHEEGFGPGVQFKLNFPAKDAQALERRLRRTFTQRKKGEWFTLNEIERREIQIIAAIVMVAAGDTLGMVPVDEDDLNLAKDLLKNLTELATERLVKKAMANAQPGAEEVPIETVPDFADFPALPDLDWNWESVLTKDYRNLPKLKGKEAYLTVIRDNNARQGRVFIDTHVVDSIDSAFVDRSLRFDLEIVLILKVDNKRKAKRDLRLASSDIGENEWVDVSDETFAEIKEFAALEWNRDSIYIGPKAHYGLETLSTDNFRANPNLDEGDSGYVVVVQGAKCGKSMKIWSSRRPRRWTRYSWRARKLNSPKALASSKNPYRFSCVIKSEHAVSFRRFLCARYRQLQRKRGWYKLDDGHLQEIRNLGR